MSQPKLSLEDVKLIRDRISFRDRELHLGVMGDGFYVQVQYTEPDVDTGKPELQKARKWYISPYSTETEIVETCFLALQRSNEHVLKEHFLYKGQRVYSPHIHIDARLALCEGKQFDGRIPPAAEKHTDYLAGERTRIDPREFEG